MAIALIGAVGELVLSTVQRGETAQLTELVQVTTDLLWAIIAEPAPGASPAVLAT